MKSEDLPANIMKEKGIEIMSGETGTSDQDKLKKYRCAQSLFNISIDLKGVELMASNVCLIIAKGLISDLKIPEEAGSMHTQQTTHDSNVSQEVEAMASKIREEING